MSHVFLQMYFSRRSYFSSLICFSALVMLAISAERAKKSFRKLSKLY